MAKKKDNSIMRLTPSQDTAFRNFIGGANLFITGKGGSGKSFLVDHIKKWCASKGYNVATCAFMGIAALNVGGSTIHRLFRPGSGVIDRRNKRCLDKKKLDVLRKIDVFIIDEISTVRADLFSYVANTILDVWKSQDDSKRKQLIVVGDFYQLPPFVVPAEEEAYKAIWGEMLYAFETPQWQQLRLQTVELQESMRQTDKEYIKALDNIREGIPDLSVFMNTQEPDPTAVTLCGRNDEVRSINGRMLRTLAKNNKKRKYISIDTGTPQAGDYPTEKELELVVRGRVIMITNDPDGRWVNGSFATIKELEDDSITVKIDGGNTVKVERNEWNIEEYEIRDANGKEPKLVKTVRATIKQFPVKLAWAISIHKSQGQTYDKVNVDVSSIFQPGMLYVALSRCRTLDGMRIVGTLTDGKVMVDQNVKKFMSAGHHAPILNGDTLHFEDEEGNDEGDDRYQEGWNDGYDYGTNEVEEKYREMVANDPSVKQLSAYTTREKEKEGLSPEERNPKGAGRKPRNPEGKMATKAIRVPESVADILKSLGEIAKDHPDQVNLYCQEVIEEFEDFKGNISHNVFLMLSEIIGWVKTYPEEWIKGAIDTTNEYYEKKIKGEI